MALVIKFEAFAFWTHLLCNSNDFMWLGRDYNVGDEELVCVDCRKVLFFVVINVK